MEPVFVIVAQKDFMRCSRMLFQGVMMGELLMQERPSRRVELGSGDISDAMQVGGVGQLAARPNADRHHLPGSCFQIMVGGMNP